MRNKRLNNNQTDSISKGGVLYRAGEIPTLNKEQIAQANLVSKLPRDFPFANWESMSTKQQLQQMQHSGLNNQDQWSLLNANVPLSVLDQHNRVQDEVETRAYVARSLAPLAAQTTQASSPRGQTVSNKSLNSTSLQTSAQQRKLDMKQEEYAPKSYVKAVTGASAAIAPKKTLGAGAAITPVNRDGKSDDSDGDDGNKDTIWEKLGGVLNNLVTNYLTSQYSPFGLKYGELMNTPLQVKNPTITDKSATPTSTPLKFTIETKPPIKTPVITPTPRPTPKPTPTPTPTPRPTANLDMISQLVTEQRNQEDPFYLKYSQDSGDRSDCSTQATDFYATKGEKSPFYGIKKDTCRSYYDVFQKLPSSIKESGGTVWSSVPRDIKKGASRIPDNWQETAQFGDVVIWVDEPEFDSAGRLLKDIPGIAWHMAVCTGNGEMIDRALWEENNPNGFEKGLFVRRFDTLKSTYEVIMIISPGDEARLTPDDVYNYLLEH